jgi:phosphopentomutase
MEGLGRVCLLLLDSLGIGASLDAVRYGDQGANTLVHIIESYGKPLAVPNLIRRGLYHAAVASSGLTFCDLSSMPLPHGLFGYAVEQSLGKDTPSGHWELTGVPVTFEWGYFPQTIPCFPTEVINAWIAQTALPGVLGDKHASGTDIIKELGLLHMQTGKPIIYTSADSVFQVAAHEESFGLTRLYEICEVMRELLAPYQIGRVIARPFVGQHGYFRRTGNRRDYSLPPPQPTLLDSLKKHGREVISIGKVADIFSHQGLTQKIKADGNAALFDATLDAMKSAPSGSLIFTNFVDFDSSYGHRRDVKGYAEALEYFDARMPELDALLQPHDWVVIAADHGCDPTFPGTDHTREHIPVLVYGPNVPSAFIGRRDTFSDVGQSIAEYLKIPPLHHGVSFAEHLNINNM